MISRIKPTLENIVIPNLETLIFVLKEIFPENKEIKSSQTSFPLYISADSAVYFLEEALKKLEQAQKHVDFIHENANLME